MQKLTKEQSCKLAELQASAETLRTASEGRKSQLEEKIYRGLESGHRKRRPRPGTRRNGRPLELTETVEKERAESNAEIRRLYNVMDKLRQQLSERSAAGHPGVNIKPRKEE